MYGQLILWLHCCSLDSFFLFLPPPLLSLFLHTLNWKDFKVAFCRYCLNNKGHLNSYIPLICTRQNGVSPPTHVICWKTHHHHRKTPISMQPVHFCFLPGIQLMSATMWPKLPQYFSVCFKDYMLWCQIEVKLIAKVREKWKKREWPKNGC